MVETNVPGTRRLHESVQSLAHVAYPVLFASFLHAFGLFHVDFFFEIAMEKSCFDVHLMYFPVKGCSNVQKNPSRFHACNRSICLSVIDTRFLCKTFCNHAHLVSNDIAIGVPLVVEDGLRRYDFSTSWYLCARYKIPHFVFA